MGGIDHQKWGGLLLFQPHYRFNYSPTNGIGDHRTKPLAVVIVYNNENVLRISLRKFELQLTLFI